MIDIITETDRLILRLPTLDDASDTYAIYGDPEVMKFIDGDEPFESVEVARQSIERGLAYYEKNGVCHYAVVLKENNTMIGHCGFNLYEQTDDLELVVHLNRKYWGQGYGTEAGKAVIAYAKEIYPTKNIYGVVNPKNTGSIKILERLGLSFLAKERFDSYYLDVYVLNP